MPKPTWLWCLSTKMLSRERALRAELWRLRREYEPWIDEVSGQERESRIGEYLHMRDEVLEKLELLATQRLSRRAAKYPTVVIPRITMSGKHHQDENWEHGHVTGTWYLKRAAYASVLRDIEDAQQRRRAVWESWLRIFGTVLPWIVTLLSVILSVMLAWPR